MAEFGCVDEDEKAISCKVICDTEIDSRYRFLRMISAPHQRERITFANTTGLLPTFKLPVSSEQRETTLPCCKQPLKNISGNTIAYGDLSYKC